MASQVSYSTVGMSDGINISNKMIMQGGVDGAFFAANQIGWGKSTFANTEFGGTTEGLLNAIENKFTQDETVISGALNTLNIRTLDTITSYTAADALLAERISNLETGNFEFASNEDIDNLFK